MCSKSHLLLSSKAARWIHVFMEPKWGHLTAACPQKRPSGNEPEVDASPRVTEDVKKLSYFYYINSILTDCQDFDHPWIINITRNLKHIYIYSTHSQQYESPVVICATVVFTRVLLPTGHFLRVFSEWTVDMDHMATQFSSVALYVTCTKHSLAIIVQDFIVTVICYTCQMERPSQHSKEAQHFLSADNEKTFSTRGVYISVKVDFILSVCNICPLKMRKLMLW